MNAIRGVLYYELSNMSERRRSEDCWVIEILNLYEPMFASFDGSLERTLPLLVKYWRELLVVPRLGGRTSREKEASVVPWKIGLRSAIWAVSLAQSPSLRCFDSW